MRSSNNKEHSPHLYIGTSGWSYSDWQDTFYPQNIKTNEWLNHYSHEFSTVEINTTFYHTPRVKTLVNWYEQVPFEFTFSVKANRFITHLKRLKDCKESVDYFYDNVKHLKTKIGPILFQLPPSFKNNKDLLSEFISNLKQENKHVFEFRHISWFTKEIYDLLNQNSIGLCITDLNGVLSPEEVTTDFTYIRLHGPQKAYKGSYGKSKLNTWKKKIEKWISSKISVYCYFDNDEKGYAIQDAKTLKSLIGVQ